MISPPPSRCCAGGRPGKGASQEAARAADFDIWASEAVDLIAEVESAAAVVERTAAWLRDAICYTAGAGQ